MSKPLAPWPEPRRQTAPVAADVLHDLARCVERLTISRHDPHRFFEDRSAIAHELRLLARGVVR